MTLRPAHPALPIRAAAALAATAALALTACGSAGGSSADGSGASDGAQPVTVFAAASLTAPFEEFADSTAVQESFSFDGSSGLVEQIKQGAPADVLVTADERTMRAAEKAGLLDGEPQQIATNELVLVTPADNPAGITGFDDSLNGTRLVVCEKSVPCGATSLKVADTAGLDLKPVSEETAVTNVLGAVTSGEADAGLVYRTDAKNAGDTVKTFPIPAASEHPTTYWVAVTAEAKNPSAARAFISDLTGEKGQNLLRSYGFGVQ
ncbi:molybdate ABC transporter substrate-binding protein [Helcobacillus massiliensis]|uniref:molybdate ABC transporter substrate-binding protein n=1 Tax=Helcobacillus massiliensis TaxID=521392 RepID=UPI0021A6A277|nr:molybdate ABC transporter substrate-binding protein [Helcobacillus massiliensis]MCT1558501.1 molybdate ABC transporter substrate-binding protein [Helcobacillus massiliensis]MCT2036040.1 molybdate ABC transporter substrate-binding protein [Helcobacillus massiliensis]MCT2332740.1 molybdate ABC transporter substrate-binding protein [Helcobacillus massiliensis]MDK7741600.1 molybdate ABC transporter substrate-binding protein [Helcobacillus massiliensis]WOO92646.1 molybdate ABC transporter substr